MFLNTVQANSEMNSYRQFNVARTVHRTAIYNIDQLDAQILVINLQSLFS